MKRILLAAAVAAVVGTAWALPSLDMVQAEIRQGHDAQAEAMMQEVLAAHPRSARALYVDAQILAHEGRFDRAAAELARARRIAPDLAFTDPARFEAFARLLARAQGGAGRAALATPGFVAGQALPTPAPGRVPGWLWGLGGAALALAAWRLFSARAPGLSPLVSAMPASLAGAMGPGYRAAGPGFAPAPAAGGGWLGTGLAAAGGAAAALVAERLFEGSRGPGWNSGGWSNPAPLSAPFDDGGAAQAARELEQRPIDFGSDLGSDPGGGDAWGADAPTGGDSDGW